MAKKKSYPTITDQFCGAGGSSQGAKKALARRGVNDGIKLALNHWKLAIETHNTNFPEAIHDCTDISACDPRRYPSTSILITSPECTNHSLAKGKKAVKAQLDMFEKGTLDPAAERSRATMWDVPRFAEYHKYECIIVENVVDARRWVMFDSWLHAMHSLGYLHQCVYHNSMHSFPTPQSRDRMYVVFWKKGNRAPDLNIHPEAWCPRCWTNVKSVQTWKNPAKRWGKYKQQYIYCCPSCAKQVEPYYYAAFNCIDWSISGTRIGDRKKPLAAKTMARIRYGYEKYGKTPLVITSRYTSGIQCRVKNLSGVIPTHPGDSSHGLFNPYLVYSGDTSKERAYPLNDAINTQTGQPRMAVVAPPFIIESFGKSKAHGIHERIGAIVGGTGINYGLLTPPPIIVQTDHQGLGEAFGSTPAGNVLQTQKTWQTMGLLMPFMVMNYSPGYSRPLTAPTGAMTTQDHHGIVSTEAFSAFLQYYYNGSTVLSGMHDTTKTLTGNDRAGLVNIQQAKSLEDCTYRMLVPGEVQRAMAFDDDYIVLGSGKDQVKQLGNAVTPPAMEMLVDRVLETLL